MEKAMQIKNMVKPSAQVVRIVNLTPGDVYKRVEKSTYSPSKILLGVVREVLVSETETTVVGIEYEKGYTDIKVTQKVMSDDDVMIYPATPEEIEEEIEGFERTLLRKVEQAEVELAKAQEAQDRFSETVQRLRAGKIQTPEIETVPGTAV